MIAFIALIILYLTNNILSDFYGTGSQHDAQEFLRYLINGLHDEVNKAKKRPKTKLIERQFDFNKFQ